MIHRHETVSEQPKLLCEKASRCFTIQYHTEDGDGRKECSNHSQCEEPTATTKNHPVCFLHVGEWGWGVEGKQVGSMDEESQVRGCYNITFICTPTNLETV